MNELEAVQDQITNAWASLHTALETNQSNERIEQIEDRLEALHAEQQEWDKFSYIH